MSSRPPLDIFGAALVDDSKAFAERLNGGVSVDTQSVTYDGMLGRNYTPLFCAVACGSLDVTELLVMRGAEVGAKNDRGQTPIHIATFSNIEILRLLLQHKADVNETDEVDATPLHYAVTIKNTQTVKLLLESQADVSILDYDFQGQKDNEPASGTTALQVAISQRQTDPTFPVEIIEMLKDAERKKNFDCKR